MILVNTTFSVDENIADAFLDFLRDVYISIAEESEFHSFILSELRVPREPNAMTARKARTFALQMRAPSQKAVDRFREDELPVLYKEIGSRWGFAVSMFESTLDVLFDTKKTE